MEKEYSKCKNCGNLAQEVRRVKRPRVIHYENGYRDEGVATVAFMGCNLCGYKWHFDYIFDPNPFRRKG